VSKRGAKRRARRHRSQLAADQQARRARRAEPVTITVQLPALGGVPTTRAAGNTSGCGTLTAATARAGLLLNPFARSEHERDRRALLAGCGTLNAECAAVPGPGGGFGGGGYLTVDVAEPPFVVVSFVSIAHTHWVHRQHRETTTTRTLMSERLHRDAAVAFAAGMERDEDTIRTLIIDTRNSSTFRHTDEGESMDRMIRAMRSEAKRAWTATQRAAERDDADPVIVPNVERKPRPGGGVVSWTSHRWPDKSDQPTFTWAAQIRSLKVLLAAMYDTGPVLTMGATFGSGTLAADAVQAVTPVFHGAGVLASAVAKVRDCNAAGCPRPQEAAGYCLLHYGRMQRYGEPGPIAPLLPGQRIAPPSTTPSKKPFALVYWREPGIVAEWSTHATLIGAQDARDALPPKTRAVILDAARWIHDRTPGMNLTDAQILSARSQRESATTDPYNYRTARLPEIDPDAHRVSDRRSRKLDREPIPR
jgi:hypothetical protein